MRGRLFLYACHDAEILPVSYLGWHVAPPTKMHVAAVINGELDCPVVVKDDLKYDRIRIGNAFDWNLGSTLVG
jgi:hypothetical protein